MRENLKSGSVRGLIVTSEPILQQKVDYEPYLTKNKSNITYLVGGISMSLCICGLRARE
jgi:hypothetical protein